MKHIMAAIDGSEPSFRALEHAAKLAKDLKAQFTILVVRQKVVGRSEILVVWSNEEVLAILDKAVELVAAAGGPEPTIIQEEAQDVGFTIIALAVEKGVDLIVMGASGRGGFKTFLLGSVANEVLKKSACPVTIVH